MNTQQAGAQTQNKYEQQATDFLKATGTTFEAHFLRNGKHFADDEANRDIYKITLKRGTRVYSFDFGQSIIHSQYYQDRIKGRTYTTDGKARTGNYKILDMAKYIRGYSYGDAPKLVNGTPPTAYDVLACLQKYDVGTFENFCSEFGYDTDSKRAEKTYKAVCEEWLNVQTLWNDIEIEQLQEIH